MSMGRRVLRILALILLIAALVICFGGLINMFRGINPMVAIDDAVAPEYPRGTVVSVEEVDIDEISPGDIISFHRTKNSLTDVLGRVVSVDPDARDPRAGYGGLLSLGRSINGVLVVERAGEEPLTIGNSFVTGKVVAVRTGFYAAVGRLVYMKWPILVAFLGGAVMMMLSIKPDGRDYLRNKAERELRRQQEQKQKRLRSASRRLMAPLSFLFDIMRSPRISEVCRSRSPYRRSRRRCSSCRSSWSLPARAWGPARDRKAWPRPSWKRGNPLRRSRRRQDPPRS